MLPQILFGHHSTQMPAIAQYIDQARFQASFAPFEAVDPGHFDLIVPLRLDQLPAARAAAARAPDRRRAVLPSAELVDLIDDKLLFNRWLVDHGFGAHVPELLADPPQSFPYIRKARHGTFGQGIRIVRGPEDEDAPQEGTFVQRIAEGRYEYVLHLLRVDGRIHFQLCYRYDMVEPVSVRGQGQAAATTEPADPGPALAPCLAILDALDFEGTCCFNYKLVDGAMQLIELNPRFGGSLVGEVTAYVAAHLEALRDGAAL
jgi:carbamoylphosphate synthase large subunit